jgi:hypothetical protein
MGGDSPDGATQQDHATTHTTDVGAASQAGPDSMVEAHLGENESAPAR